MRNAEPGYTFYERGVVNGERKRDFIDAGDARPLGVIIYYLLSDQAKEVSLSILDEAGQRDPHLRQGRDSHRAVQSRFDNRGTGRISVDRRSQGQRRQRA